MKLQAIVALACLVSGLLTGCGASKALKAAKTPAEASQASPQYAAGWAAYVKNDYAKALQQWLPLAEQGVARAQVSVGQVYDFSLTPPEYNNAVIWYRKAAEQGDPQGQSNLGLEYMLGLGVPQDYVLAHKWLNLGAAGLTDAKAREATVDNIELVETKMTTGQIAEAQKLAREWKAK
jgi:TPR repeat protein